jgi:hypothetical protein
LQCPYMRISSAKSCGSHDICAICKSVPVGLRACIIDLCSIDRLFDSGVALLKKLHRRLVENDIIVVILSDSSEIRERMPAVTHLPSAFFQGRPSPSPIGRSAETRLSAC